MSGTALADSRTSLGWHEVREVVRRAAAALHSIAYCGARRVAVLAPNANETALAYLAGLHAGVSSVPVNFHLTSHEVAYILRDSGAQVLFVGPETSAVGLEAARLAGVRTVVGWRCAAQPGLVSWEVWLREEHPDAPANLLPQPYLHYTSGTTGTPKATHTPPTMFPRVASVAELLDVYRRETAAVPPGPLLVVGPMYHTGPLQSIKRLAGDIPLVIMERFDAESVLRLIERHRIATTVMVPTHFERLLALPEHVRAAYDVSSLRAVTHTGAPCAPRTKRAMIDWFGPVLVEAYGGTESGTTNLITSQEWLKRPGSVGRCVPGFEAVVLDDRNEPLPPGHTGRLFFRDLSGRGIEYEGDPEKTAAAHVAPGVFTLGEIGYVDGDGYVFITDRVSDMIVSGGVNIYPAEAEQVLLQHEDVADVAVIGVPDAHMGEAVKALIVARDGVQPDPQALDDFCRSRIAGFKCPRSYDIVSSLGRNALGKLNKRELRKPYWPTARTIGG
jgi:acyl-CoA synthetase (AMP-forming)/AMP-acid ligase II